MTEPSYQECGKKIPDHYENPIDILLLELNGYMNPWYRRMGFTPNLLTTVSLVVTVVGLGIYRYGFTVLGAILYFVGYYFDCADGNFARRYNLVTTFGDYYDHISDVFKYLVFMWVLLASPISNQYKLGVIAVLLVFLTGMLVHFGCQERLYNREGESGTLSFFKTWCQDTEWINQTRYLGCGTFQLTITIILLLLPTFR